MLDDRIFQTSVIAPEFCGPQVPLPHHQIVFNAIGDADLAVESLHAAQSVVERTIAPVINPPAAVLLTGRAEQGRLSRIAGLVAPLSVRLPRDLLESRAGAVTVARHGFQFPFLVRSPGFHTGRHFIRVEDEKGLADGIETLPGRELLLIQFLDARDTNGKVRKYRVMMIDGRLYPLHLAISDVWKVHYFTANMADHEGNRQEDARFLEDMPGVIGARAMETLAGIQETLGLDYGGIDFGLSPTGEVLLFEANATMVVNPPDPGERWDYRRPAVERIFAAVRAMLMRANCRYGPTGAEPGNG